MKIANFKMFDNNFRRLALILIETKGKKARVFKLTCSKDDQFSKKEAWSVFEQWQAGILDSSKYHPEIFEIELKDETKPKTSFLKYCKENYWFVNHIPSEIFCETFITIPVYSQFVPLKEGETEDDRLIRSKLNIRQIQLLKD